MISCGREKTRCKSCEDNVNGWCKRVDRSVDELYKQWFNQRRYRVRKKLDDNEIFFREETYEFITNNIDVIFNSELKSKEHIQAMNKLAELLRRWKYIDVEFL